MARVTMPFEQPAHQRVLAERRCGLICERRVRRDLGQARILRRTFEQFLVDERRHGDSSQRW